MGSSMPPDQLRQLREMERRKERSFDISKSGRSVGSSSLREIDEERTATWLLGEEEEEEVVFVALGKEVKESTANLMWVLNNTTPFWKKKKKNQKTKIVVVHVLRRSPLIPMMGGWFPENQLADEKVKAFRQLEMEKMNACIDEYQLICTQQQFLFEKKIIEADDIAKGLIDIISQCGITNFVMGAAADRHFSKKMNGLKSRKAVTVCQQADPSCKIWFVCKGSLICTREVGQDELLFWQSPSRSPNFNQPEHLRSRSLPGPRSRSGTIDFRGFGSESSATSTLERAFRLSTEGGESVDNLEFTAEDSQFSDNSLRYRVSDHSLRSGSEEICTSISFPPGSTDGRSEAGLPGLPFPEPDDIVLRSFDVLVLEDPKVGGSDVYEKLQEALEEAEQSRCNSYEESHRRQKAEKDAIDAARNAKASESLYVRELKLRKEVEETLSRGRLEVDELRNQIDKSAEHLREAREHRVALERQISENQHLVKDLEDSLLETQRLVDMLRTEHVELQRERDVAVREIEELSWTREGAFNSTSCRVHFSEFSYSELQNATDNFDDSMKIGEGGYGSVYKGFLRHTMVAIKFLNPASMQGRPEFFQELDVLSRVRHPNLVTLIGACPEAYALVYEFLTNGSLEDRLECRGDTPPLPWQARVGIAAEICSALIFLHSCRPEVVVHGDLKTANILLDANLVSKLGDFGICRLLVSSNITTNIYHDTSTPKGTLAYMDPEFVTTGHLTPGSDTYSFGVILLRLLTGKPALGLVSKVRRALEQLHEILDASAGDWPVILAKQLANLALQCCDMQRKSRPNLKEAWRVLEPMMKMECFPSYFMCPLSQEVMRDPHIAADGISYEAKAIKEWLDRGHDTSPKTNRELSHRELIPNKALRAAIQEWLQHCKK